MGKYGGAGQSTGEHGQHFSVRCEELDTWPFCSVGARLRGLGCIVSVPSEAQSGEPTKVATPPHPQPRVQALGAAKPSSPLSAELALYPHGPGLFCPWVWGGSSLQTLGLGGCRAVSEVLGPGVPAEGAGWQPREEVVAPAASPGVCRDLEGAAWTPHVSLTHSPTAKAASGGRVEKGVLVPASKVHGGWGILWGPPGAAFWGFQSRLCPGLALCP